MKETSENKVKFMEDIENERRHPGFWIVLICVLIAGGVFAWLYLT